MVTDSISIFCFALTIARSHSAFFFSSLRSLVLYYVISWLVWFVVEHKRLFKIIRMSAAVTLEK